MPRSKRIEVPCAHCGAILSRAPSIIASRKNQFCDQSCHMAYKTAQGTVQVTCAQCGATLTRNRWQMAHMTHHFCNQECHNTFQVGRPLPQNERKVFTRCAQCGKVFPHERTKNRIYCSKACSGKAIGARVIAEQRPRRQFIKRIQVDCAYCGKTLDRTPLLAAKFERHFCDPTCKASWNGRHIRGVAHPLYSRVLATCAQCGAPLTTSRARADSQPHHFCDKDCYREWRSGRFVGSDSATWKGGNCLKYYGPNWKQQRRKARERDGYKCQHCGITEEENGQELDVHHLTPFRRYGIDNYRVANQLDNLIALCRNCHPSAEAGKIALQPKLL